MHTIVLNIAIVKLMTTTCITLPFESSAGLHIRTTGCSFESYLQQLPHSHSKASRIKAPGSDYPDTLISAIAEATRQIAKSDDCLEKVIYLYVYYRLRNYAGAFL